MKSLANQHRELHGTVPDLCSEPYSFAAYLCQLGKDYFTDDPDLELIMRHHGLTESAIERLSNWGRYVATVAVDSANDTDRPGHLPELIPFDAHGLPHPVGVEVPAATRSVLADSLQAGLATEENTVLRYGLTYLGSQAGEAGVMCPLACTDGLVRAITELSCGTEAQAAAQHIISQTGSEPIHGAQFVTEVQGGSDAGTNRVRAELQDDGTYRLYGQKWFCSNVWAQYWAVTARPTDAPEGNRGVGLFFVPRERPKGTANGFRIDRIKDKLGSRALPTVELTFDGAVAYPIGDLQSGLSNVVRIVLSTSRFWCAIAAVSFIRSAERIAESYANFRTAFGTTIKDFPLVADSLENLRRDRRELLAANFEVLSVWDRVVAAERRGEKPDKQEMIRARILLMMSKVVCTRRATKRVHDAMMVLAGNGIEERFSALPRLLRDAIILETWEGPHGLLLARQLLDIKKYCSQDSPEEIVLLLLGNKPSETERNKLSLELAQILEDSDDHRAALNFSRWADDLYQTLGAVAWRSLSGQPDNR